MHKGEAIEEEYQKYAQLLKQKRSNEQERASILSEIESVAARIDLRIADRKPKKVREIDFYNNFSVSLTIEGELGNIIHFLYLLQSDPHQFNVDEVRFEKKSRRRSDIKCYLVLSRNLISQ